ncbi:MAG: nucleotide exchange factor GrpE [Planctomycetes bacterium]|nr:nucleotide exchange factor GrpE [Planctomycetota bacterium]
MTTDAELSLNAEQPAEFDAAACRAQEQDPDTLPNSDVPPVSNVLIPEENSHSGIAPLESQQVDHACDTTGSQRVIPGVADGEMSDAIPPDFALPVATQPDIAPECQAGFACDPNTEVSNTEMFEPSDEELPDNEELPNEEISDDEELPDEDELLIERMRDWLMEVRADAPAAEWPVSDDADGELDAPGPGLLRLVEEFTALRHDVKLQAKSARGVQDQAEGMLSGLARAIEQFQSVLPREQQAARAAVRSMLEALVELDVAFDRGRLATEAARRRWLDAGANLWRETVAAELQSLSWWRRLCLGTLKERLPRAMHEQAERACTATFDAQLDGYRLVQNRLRRLLAQNDVERLETVGRLADPNRMTIVEVTDQHDVPEGTVLDELRPGYNWRGEVLRFAEVRVARGGEGHDKG